MTESRNGRKKFMMMELTKIRKEKKNLKVKPLWIIEIKLGMRKKERKTKKLNKY